ncbi:hypothetical protein [Thaumasiovibrio sp. DFM-14]|uniref:hypothetical protein n=1 Tax=Thaumasiovibrio sp. DFM-14 TaxID=3384792 RepID=UPI0039A1F788
MKLIEAVIPVFLWVSTPVLAQGCFDGETDGSEWFSKTIHYPTPLVIDYQSSVWDDIHHLFFDFDVDKVDNPRSFRVTGELNQPITERQSIWGRLEGWSGGTGGSLYPGQSFHMNLNLPQYFEKLEDGEILLGLGRSGSMEHVELNSLTATFCGVRVLDGQTVFVDATQHALGSVDGAAMSWPVEPQVTYVATVSGNASDGQNRKLAGVSVQYNDPRARANVVKNMIPDQPTYIHSEGELRFFYVSETDENTGGYTVSLKRVNLDE